MSEHHQQYQEIAGTYPEVNKETHNAVTMLLTGCIELGSQYPGMLPHLTSIETILHHVFPTDTKGRFRLNPSALHLLEIGAEDGFECEEGEWFD